MNTETIAAIASGMSASGISIIRISGSEAFCIADRIFKSASGKTVSDMHTFTVAYGHIVHNDRVIDEVLLLKMKAPHSYTCEDVVEIDCHGGIVVTKKVLEAVFAAGARPADPGEFTKRAFLNGRIDLSQAEAVSDIISAKSDLALKNSLKQLQGDVKNKISELRERLLREAAFIEAALDDPEHYSLDGFSDDLSVHVNEVLVELQKLIKSSDNGRILREGIDTVILGCPNAGKSSLLNVLLGEERAIVTDIAGTTRDTLEESVIINGLVLNLIDTAGIRETDNIVEKIGVDRAYEAAKSADLILYVIDGILGVTDEDKDNFKYLAQYAIGKKIILLINKTDAMNIDGSDISARDEHLQEYYGLNVHSTLYISALSHAGIEELKQLITDIFFSGELTFNDEIYITNMRQKNLLIEAGNSLNNVITSIEAGMPEDFFTIDLMAAYTSLGLITGENIEDDLADKIFSEFCMGK